MEVVPVFLEMLHTQTADLPQAQRLVLYSRIYKRLGEGMRKYGKPLVTNNGRDSLLDAWEEACDGAQYLVQAYCEGKLRNPALMKEMIRLMLALEDEISEQNRSSGEYIPVEGSGTTAHLAKEERLD